MGSVRRKKGVLFTRKSFLQGAYFESGSVGGESDVVELLNLLLKK